MIVFSQDDYLWLNYKDKVSPLTCLFKINKVTIQNVETPLLSSNSVIIFKSGTIQSSGSPYPGGKIYLQNNFVAINYDPNLTGFEIVYSKGYRFESCYAQLSPLKHMSTPFARLMKQVPLSMTFVDNGTLAIFDDAKMNGLQADYYALDGGEIIAAFNTKDQTYFTLPLPPSYDNHYWYGLADVLKKNGQDACMQYVPGVEGLMSDSSIKNHISENQARMARYEELQLDLEIAQSFIAPASDALVKQGTVNSCLSIENFRLLISDKIKRGEKTDDLLVGIVLNDEGFNSLIKNGFTGESLFEYVTLENSYIPSDALILLKSDFQTILDEYASLYDKFLLEQAKAAFGKMKADLYTLQNNINKVCGPAVLDKIKNVLKNSPTCANAEVINKATPSWNISKISEMEIFEKTSEGGGHEWLEYCKQVIEMHGQDTDLTEEIINQAVSKGDSELNFINPNLCLKGGQKSFIWHQAVESMMEKVYTLLDPLKKNLDSLHQQMFVQQVKKEKGRYWGLTKDESWYYEPFNNKPFTGNITHITLNNTSIKFRLVLTSAQYDEEVTDDLDYIVNKMRDDVKSFLMKNLGMVNVQFLGYYNPYPAWRMWFKSRWKKYNDGWGGAGGTSGSLGKKSYLQFTFEFEKDLRTNLASSGLKPADKVECIYGDINLIKPKERIANAKLIAALFTKAVKQYAANAAYDYCAPLMQNIKDAYEFNCIGTIGIGYDGVMVNMDDLAKISAIDEQFVDGLIKLIRETSNIDIEVYNKLKTFEQELKGASAKWKLTQPIMYVSKNRLNQASRVQNKDAILHYLLGGI